MTKKKGPEKTVEVTLCSEGPLHFLLQRERGKRKDADNGFRQRGQSPHFLRHTSHQFYLEGVKAGTFTKALCQELLLQIKARICMRRNGSFPGS